MKKQMWRKMWMGIPRTHTIAIASFVRSGSSLRISENGLCLVASMKHSNDLQNDVAWGEAHEARGSTGMRAKMYRWCWEGSCDWFSRLFVSVDIGVGFGKHRKIMWRPLRCSSYYSKDGITRWSECGDLRGTLFRLIGKVNRSRVIEKKGCGDHQLLGLPTPHFKPISPPPKK